MKKKRRKNLSGHTDPSATRQDPKAGPGLNLRPFDISVDEEIDLHGMSVDEAMAAVELGLERHRSFSGAIIRVIHGQSSDNPGSIKATLRRNLQSQWQRLILGFRPEPGNAGSTLIKVGRG